MGSVEVNFPIPAYAGGLVGYNWEGTIIACYATGRVVAMIPKESASSTIAGGLVGLHANSIYSKNALIVACYARGDVTGENYRFDRRKVVGSLVESSINGATIIVSYYDSTAVVSSLGPGRVNTFGKAKTPAELQQPTTYEGIYATWAMDVDGLAVVGRRIVWDLGTSNDYPTLRADFDGNGTPPTADEFGPQNSVDRILPLIFPIAPPPAPLTIMEPAVLPPVDEDPLITPVRLTAMLANAVSIYPNPVRDLLHIVHLIPHGYEVTLLTLAGEPVLRAMAPVSLDMRTLASGVYLLLVSFDGKTTHHRVVKG